MIIHSPIISGSLTFADGATFTLPDNGQYSGSFSGSAQFSTIGSDLIPDTSGAYDLGSEAYPFQDLWLVGNTANIGGISLGVSAGGLNIKNKSTGNAAPIAASTITIGGILGGAGSKKFVLNDDGEIESQDVDGNPANLKTGGLIISSSNGAVTMSVDSNGEVVTTTSAGIQASSNLSGSFTGSVKDLVGDGDATFNNAVTISGLSSLDGGIDVDGVFTVADTSGNVSTTGTLAAGNTTITGTVDASGLASLDGGIDVDGAFTVSDTSGNVSTTGTLSAGATTLTSTVDVTGLASLDGGIDVDGAFTVADTSGNVSTTGTITVPEGNLTIGSTAVNATAAELNLLDGSVAGTVTNSKAVVYGAAGEVNATKLQVGGVDITATPAELNLLDGVAGLVQADFTKLAAIEVDATKINYLTDVTGNLKNYIDTEVAGIVDSAPGTLDTLNELAAALGDDPNFATTISAQIGGKVSQSLALTAGNGLTGGGDLTADRTFDVVGTTDRISVSADAVDIASTYVGQTSITTLGTITTGVWQGTAIASAYIAADAIDGTKIADDSIDSEHYVDGSIDTAHIADAAVTSAKLAGSYTGTWAVTGAITATGDITAYASSDERLKDNIEVISNPIEKVQQLKGVTWDWNDNASEVQHSLPNVGVIAQDVEKVLPQLVRDNEGGYKAVDYDKLVGLLIEAIKDQQKQIDDLKSKI